MEPAAPLPVPHLRVALHYATADSRPLFASLFQFDAMFARVLADASQPLVAQLRLAWWRDELERTDPPASDPTPLLAEARALWGAPAAPVIALLDGWENLLDDTAEAVRLFTAGREAAVRALTLLLGQDAAASAAMLAARRWSLAELAQASFLPLRKRELLQEGRALPRTGALPRTLRPLAVLDALARVSLARDRPLLDGRRSLLAAMRAGQFGR